jgi:hypothetical protein
MIILSSALVIFHVYNIQPCCSQDLPPTTLSFPTKKVDKPFKAVKCPLVDV